MLNKQKFNRSKVNINTGYIATTEIRNFNFDNFLFDDEKVLCMYLQNQLSFRQVVGIEMYKYQSDIISVRPFFLNFNELELNHGTIRVKIYNSSFKIVNKLTRKILENFENYELDRFDFEIEQYPAHKYIELSINLPREYHPLLVHFLLSQSINIDNI